LPIPIELVAIAAEVLLLPVEARELILPLVLAEVALLAKLFVDALFVGGELLFVLFGSLEAVREVLLLGAGIELGADRVVRLLSLLPGGDLLLELAPLFLELLLTRFEIAQRLGPLLRALGELGTTLLDVIELSAVLLALQLV